MTRCEKIKETLDGMGTAELIAVHDNYCDASGNMDDYIYNMDEFDEICAGMTPWKVARAAYCSGKFCPAHDYFWFNGYGNLESDDFTPSIIYIDDIAEYIDRNDNSLYSDDIQEVLDEYEGEDDETESA